MPKATLAIILVAAAVAIAVHSRPVPSPQSGPAVDQLDGNKLLEYCSVKGEREPAEIACFFYIGGVRDGLGIGMIAAKEQKVSGVNVCLPPLLRNDQTVRIVVKYLNDHPGKLQEPAPVLVLWALQEAYPCKP